MLTIDAIIAVHNGAATLPRVLEHLEANRIAAHVINHGSRDETLAILERYRRKPVMQVVHKPFDGVFCMQDQIIWKNEIFRTLDVDWIIHLDVDEIMESPVEGESLRGMIERADREGYDVLDCDEFMFVPLNEVEDFRGTDFVKEMRRYYYFRPLKLMNHRVIRLRSGFPDWERSGGHRLDLTNRKVSPEHIRKRHYPGLSLNALRSQYLSRVFHPEELRRGWHHNRIATTADFVIAPPANRLLNLDKDGWSTEYPEPKHLMFNDPLPYLCPPRLNAFTDRPPMPFIVGMERSGTTLLRLLLDAHPDLAIPPETPWLTATIKILSRAHSTMRLRHVLSSNTYWRDMGLSDQELVNIIKQHRPNKPIDTIRAIYRFYAKRRGATRYGDKTPSHSMHMVTIARHLPEAHFIHIIRDGRDVGLSLRDTWWAPKDMTSAAKQWTWRIHDARQQAQFLPRYMEVRYERLVTDTQAVLEEIGAFIGLPFHPDQLRAHEHASARLDELQDIQYERLYIKAHRRKALLSHTLNPPDPTRIGRWQTELTPEEITEFEAIGGNMLYDLGYK